MQGVAAASSRISNIENQRKIKTIHTASFFDSGMDNDNAVVSVEILRTSYSKSFSTGAFADPYGVLTCSSVRDSLGRAVRCFPRLFSRWRMDIGRFIPFCICFQLSSTILLLSPRVFQGGCHLETEAQRQQRRAFSFSME